MLAEKDLFPSSYILACQHAEVGRFRKTRGKDVKCAGLHFLQVGRLKNNPAYMGIISCSFHEKKYIILHKKEYTISLKFETLMASV